MAELSRAEWGGHFPLNDIEATHMMMAWVRRKRFEAKLIASEVWTLLGEAMPSSSPSQGKQPESADNTTMSATQFMNQFR